MEKNGLGVSMGDMIDFDQIIDTETGTLVTGVANTPVVDEEEAKGGKEVKDLIEVNIEEIETEIEDESSTGGDAIVDGVQPSSSLPFKVLAKALHEQGVLSELDDSKFENADEDGGELLIGLIKNEIEKNNSSYRSGLPQVIKDLIENYEENVPLDKLIGMESTKMRLDTITDEQLKADVELQKIVISENYRRKGLPDAKIKKRLQQFDDLDQMEEESLEALNESKEFISSSINAEKENAKNQSAKAEQERLANLKSLKEDINNTNNLIEGVKISNKEKDLIYDSMTKVVDKDEAGRPMNKVMVTRAKNPIGFEKLLHYYHSLGMFNIDDDGKLIPDISKIKTGAKTSAMDDLNSAIRSSQLPSSGTPARESTVDRSKMKENINSMKGLFK